MQNQESEFLTKLAEKKYKKAFSDIQKKAYLEAAKNFGWFFSDGQKKGLSREMAFFAAKNHFLTYGQAMIDVGNMVTPELVGMDKP